MTICLRGGLALVVLLPSFVFGALAQTRYSAGVLGGIATLSGDAGSLATPQTVSLSSYRPENGPLLSAVAGVDFHRYLTLQLTYAWQGNSITMNSTSSGSDFFYVQQRSSRQQSAVVDLLVYFRSPESRLRPYLAVGTGLDYLISTEQRTTAVNAAAVLPPVRFSSIEPVLHVPVGIDVALGRNFSLRYSFSETIRHNDMSEKLFPQGQHSLANFHNLFGIVRRF